MADNPIETAAQELKKWLDQLAQLMKHMEAQKEKLAAAEKAVADKALAAHQRMVDKSEVMEKLKAIEKGIQETPDDTPGKEQALEELEAAKENIGEQLEGEELAPEGNELDAADDLEVEGLEEAAEGLEEAVEGIEKAADQAGEAVEQASQGIQQAAGALAGGAGGAPAVGAPAAAPAAPAAGIEAPGAAAWKKGSVGAALEKEGYPVKRAGGPRIGQQRAVNIGAHRRR